MIGVVIFEEPDGLFTDPVLLELLHGINAELSRHDTILTLGTVAASDDPIATFRRLVESYRVDGCLVETTRREDGLDFFVDHTTPCVVLGHTDHPLPHIHPADRDGARTLAEHVLDLGHRTIGVITGPPGTLAVEARQQGYRDAMRRRGISLVPTLIQSGTFHFEAGYQGAARLMSRPPLPTAILAHNDRMALGTMRWLQEHDYRIPEDISVAGFDDIAQAAQASPPLTTVRQKPADIGRRAARILLIAIMGKAVADEDNKAMPPAGPADDLDVEMPTTLIVRRSTGPAPTERAKTGTARRAL
jgi:DNA-binding LacI/PurR family transcriptional regulator